MPDVVKVSSVEKIEQLKTYLAELFKQGKYTEMTQAVGMHAVLMDPQHAMHDQAGLNHYVLDMIKGRITAQKGSAYGAWYSCFSKAMDHLVTSRQIVTTAAAADIAASHRAAYGPFKSLDDFFFWAMEDRRMSLDQIVKYIEKTLEISVC